MQRLDYNTYLTYIARLDVTTEEINPYHPYVKPGKKTKHATGFLIDNYIVTNAHAVEHSTDILANFPDTSARCHVKSICVEKDLALLRPEWLDSPLRGGLRLSNSIEVNYGDRVSSLGYPFGMNASVTTGIVSGFNHMEVNHVHDILPSAPHEDSWTRNPSFIQFTATTNPGNSGSPLLNEQGFVIGIVSAVHEEGQNLNFAIGASTLIAILDALKNTDGVVRTPSWGISWGILEEGLLVSRVYEDSSLGLAVDDIVLGISFPLTDNNLITTVFRRGLADVWINERKLQRKFSVAEIADIIPLNAEINVYLNNDRQVKVTNILKPSLRLRYFVLPMETIQYTIVGGMCFADLTINHVVDEVCPRHLIKKPSDRYKPRVVFVSHLIPPDYDNALTVGDKIKSVNDETVENVEQMNNVIRRAQDFITIKTYNHKIVTLYIDDIYYEDKQLYEEYNLPLDMYPVQSSMMEILSL
jgi:V8-like Glu-specific endopeptidase